MNNIVVACFLTHSVQGGPKNGAALMFLNISVKS